MAPESKPTRGPRKVVRMGKYEVLAHIATGGMGAVYRARDTENDRDVALKVLTAEMAARPKMVDRFKSEAESARKLCHENIVRVYESGTFHGTHFIAMEFVNGIDLYEYVKREGPLDPEQARQIILQGCRALIHAFDLDIIHRDIKPSNFLLTWKNKRPQIKLTDMGLARDVSADDFRVTSPGTTVGTLDYMAPEQARDSRLADIRSDLYSLGSTWYHLLTGRAPFPEGGLGERLLKLITEDPPDPRESNPQVSDSTWKVLRKLLAKEPDDRYQTPTELLDDLLALEGKATAPQRQPRAEVARTKKIRRTPRSGETRRDTDAGPPPRTAVQRRSRWPVWLATGGAACVLLALVVVAAVSGGRTPPPSGPGPEHPLTIAGGGTVTPPVIPPAIATDKAGPASTSGKDKTREPGSTSGERPSNPPRERSRWPFLYTPALPISTERLRQQMEAPWISDPAPAGEVFVARVCRVPGAGDFSSLAAAYAAASAKTGKLVVIEIHDNGPLFETPVALADRHITLKAGKGYRPLVVWDVSRTLEERKKRPGAASEEGVKPLRFLALDRGSLTLEGIDLVCRWPTSAGDEPILLDVQQGQLLLQDCTVSVAGKHRTGVTLARLQGSPAIATGPAKCRFTRCQVRGGSLTLLDLDCSSAEVLLDGCLAVGGEQPLLKVKTDSKKGVDLRVVRSTLVAGRTLLEIRSDSTVANSPAVRWLGWDALLARSSTTHGGELLALREGADSQEMSWQSHNVLYAGWQSLLAGPKALADLESWQRHWRQVEGDGVAREPWPAQVFNELAAVPAGVFTPTKEVCFASMVDPDKPLGCDLAALPSGTDRLSATLVDPVVTQPELLAEDGPPDIPNPGDTAYHGERIDLKDRDLGAYLLSVQQTRKLGPKVVLHLTGKGERLTTPIRLKGVHLTLYFEPPAGKEDPPLVLRLSGASAVADPAALVDLEDGSLEVVGGHLKVADLPGPRVPWVVKVKGGNVRLFRTRLEGPQHSIPEQFRGLLSLEGSGETDVEKTRGCALNECVLLSGRAGVALQGVGTRLNTRQCLIVAGTEAVRVALAGCKGRANVQCLLKNTTLAARQATLRLGNAPESGVPAEGVLVQTRDCAFMNPFPGKPNAAAGLLLYEGGALPRGLLICQGEGDTFDKRLFFGVAAVSAEGRGPDKADGLGDWARVWGSEGVRSCRGELTPVRQFDPRRWNLEWLILPSGRGANAEALGVRAKKGKT